MKTNMLRALWMVGLVLALACGSSSGGNDPETDTTQPPGDSTTPPEDMTIPPFECDPPCGEGEACENGTCVPVTPSGSKTLTEIFEPVFQNKGCTAGYCHGGSVDELLLSDVDSIFANLVNQAASIPACGLTLRVVPGNPEESILWHRVKPMADGEDPCVSKMPKGSNGLSEEDAQLVYDWILGGALQ